MTEVVTFPAPLVMTTPDLALREALERGLTSVLILGYTPENTLYVRSSGDVTRKDALWLLEHGRMNALAIGPYAEDEDA